jgi:hypothetical protein
LLGVTRQRVHQVVVALAARGLVRLGDPNFPTFVIALKDDSSILLQQKQERVLSAFPEAAATTLSKITLVTQMHRSEVDIIAATPKAQECCPYPKQIAIRTARVDT